MTLIHFAQCLSHLCLIKSVCVLVSVSEAEAETSESHLQLCSRQPRRADLL